jgi:hypothetical protein
MAAGRPSIAIESNKSLLAIAEGLVRLAPGSGFNS